MCFTFLIDLICQQLGQRVPKGPIRLNVLMEHRQGAGVTENIFFEYMQKRARARFNRDNTFSLKDKKPICIKAADILANATYRIVNDPRRLKLIEDDQPSEFEQGQGASIELDAGMIQSLKDGAMVQDVGRRLRAP